MNEAINLEVKALVWVVSILGTFIAFLVWAVIIPFVKHRLRAIDSRISKVELKQESQQKEYLNIHKDLAIIKTELGFIRSSLSKKAA